MVAPSCLVDHLGLAGPSADEVGRLGSAGPSADGVGRLGSAGPSAAGVGRLDLAGPSDATGQLALWVVLGWQPTDWAGAFGEGIPPDCAVLMGLVGRPLRRVRSWHVLERASHWAGRRVVPGRLGHWVVRWAGVPLRAQLRRLGLEDRWVKKESRRQAPVTIGSNAELVSWQKAVSLNNRWGKTRLT